MNLRLSVTGVAGVFALVPVLAAPSPGSDSVRVYFGETCIVADEPVVSAELAQSKLPGLAGIVASNTGQALLASIIRGIGRLIGSSSSNRETVYAVDREMYLYSVDYSASTRPRLASELGCFTVVAGSFEPDSVDCIRDYEPLFLDGGRIDETVLSELRARRDINNVLRRANVCMRETPSFVFENRIEQSEDGTAFRLNGAGHQLNSLPSSRRNDRRALLLTLSIFEPSADGRGQHLATSWINYGELTPGTVVVEDIDDSLSGWTTAPALSPTAAAAYQADARLHKNASSEAAELERAIIRHSRQLTSLEKQRETVEPRLRPALQEEMDRLNVRLVADNAALDAWLAEYDDLPAGEYRYMPVTIRVSVVQARSERQVLRQVGELLEAYSEDIATDLAVSAYRD